MPRQKRDWDRVTDVVRLVACTGMVLDTVARDRVEPVSLLIYGDPGTGKTTLLKRFDMNHVLVFRDDLTWMGVMDLLRQAKHHAITHVVFPEFQKLMQRKGDTWENTIGILGQAIEDGVTDSQVGPIRVRLDGTRIGMIAAMTGDSFAENQRYFESKGIISRIIPLRWDSTEESALRIYEKMRTGNKRDMAKVRLPRIKHLPVHVRVSAPLGKKLERWVHHELGMDIKDKRPVVQFRALLCAAALLRVGERVRVASEADLKTLQRYDDIWKGALQQ